MTTLRRFTPPTQTNIIHVQESIQFRELCWLGGPSPYDRDQDTVRFQPPTE